MKNTIKTFALIFAAALLFAACAQQASSSSTPDINEPLFEEKDVPLSATKYEISDGNWIYRTILKLPDSTRSDQFEFAMKGGRVEDSENGLQKYMLSINGILPDGVSEAQKESYKTLGYTIKDNKYSFTKEYDKMGISELYKKVMSNPSMESNNPEYIAYRAIMSGMVAGNNLNNRTAPSGCKTNEGKTKYMWTETKRYYNTPSSSTSVQTGTTTSYLAKK